MNPIQIGVIILILVVAVLNFVMIAELPFFISGLQIKSKIDGPETTLPNAVEAPENLDSSAKGRMDRMRKVADNPVYILYRNRRYDRGLER